MPEQYLAHLRAAHNGLVLPRGPEQALQGPLDLQGLQNSTTKVKGREHQKVKDKKQYYSSSNEGQTWYQPHAQLILLTLCNKIRAVPGTSPIKIGFNSSHSSGA